jgi:hypothetical protein
MSRSPPGFILGAAPLVVMTGRDDARGTHSAGTPMVDGEGGDAGARTEDVVVITRRADGSVAARDEFTGLARGGDTRAEALARLADALAADDGDRNDDLSGPDALRADDVEGELSAEEVRDDRDLPEFLE